MKTFLIFVAVIALLFPSKDLGGFISLMLFLGCMTLAVILTIYGK